MAAVELSSLTLSLSPAGHYKLEDVNDSSGNSRTLTNNGSTTFVAAKFNNGSSHTLGANKFFTRSDNYGVAGNGNLSISTWLKITAAPTTGQVFGLFIHRSQTTADRFISLAYQNSGGTLQLLVNNSGTSATYNVDLGTSSFYNIVLVRNTTTSFNLYLNGIDTGITAAQGATTAGSDTFGLATDGGVDPTATIDDFGVFAGALTQADVNLINDITATTTDSSYSYFM